MNYLTTAESAALTTLEKTIEGGIKSFLQVGEALWKIREGKLYRATHTTFEEYCRERWNIARSRAYQLIEASETVKALPKEMSTIVDNEGKARELAKVPAEKREVVIQKALESGPVTAKSIREAARDTSTVLPARRGIVRGIIRRIQPVPVEIVETRLGPSKKNYSKKWSEHEGCRIAFEFEKLIQRELNRYHPKHRDRILEAVQNALDTKRREGGSSDEQ